jgi:hypothetical protein
MARRDPATTRLDVGNVRRSSYIGTAARLPTIAAGRSSRVRWSNSTGVRTAPLHHARDDGALPMRRHPDLVYIPATLIDDRRIGDRDRANLMHLIALADTTARCDHDEHALARELGITTRTLRKRLARLEDLGYVVNHRSWVEMSDDLVLADDCVFMADLPPLSDDEFAQLQEADDPDEFLKQHAGDLAGRRLFVDLPRTVVTARPAPRRALQPEVE